MIYETHILKEHRSTTETLRGENIFYIFQYEQRARQYRQHHFTVSFIVLALAQGFCSELQIAQLKYSSHCLEP